MAAVVKEKMGSPKPLIVKEGKLVMRAISGRFGYHPWKTMHFTVDDHLSLSYYKPSSGKLRGQIVLTFDTEIATSSKKAHAFSVKTPYVTLHARIVRPGARRVDGGHRERRQNGERGAQERHVEEYEKQMRRTRGRRRRRRLRRRARTSSTRPAPTLRSTNATRTSSP